MTVLVDVIFALMSQQIHSMVEIGPNFGFQNACSITQVSFGK